MDLNCTQMDILISFYLENELSSCLKSKVEAHLEECPICSAKYEMVKTMIDDMKESVSAKNMKNQYETLSHKSTESGQYKLFKTNLSAYMDNELSGEENLKIKKFTINNKNARKDLEDNYSIRKLMSESFEKTKTDAKQDFSKNVLNKINNEDYTLGFHPAINLLIAFTVSVLIVTTIVLISLSV